MFDSGAFALTHSRLTALGLGLVSAVALPPIHALPVLWLAFPGLVFLLRRQRSWVAAGVIGFCFGLGHHIAGLYWITEAILIEATTFGWLVPLGVPLLAALLALFIVVPCVIAHFAAPTGRSLVLAGAWVLAELARQMVLSGFPWNPLGSVWAMPGLAGDAMIQPASWVGVHGLTLATLMVSFAPLVGRRGMVMAGVTLAVWGGFGLARLAPNPMASQPISIVLVQGNIAQDGKWERERALRNFNRYLDLTRDGVAEARGARTVTIWPETASPFLIDRDPDARAAVVAAAGGPAFIGSLRFDAARRPYNSLMALDIPGSIGAVYDKWHLVPFGEYQPGWFPLPIAFVSGEGFGRGSGPQTWRLPGIPAVGPLICYEAIFPGEGVAADRPEWLINVTNDAWFGNSTGPRQHLAAARMRAVEEGLPLMRAANTGISAGFDAYGRELGRLGMNQAGSLVLVLPGALAPTPAARGRLLIPLGLALGSLATGLIISRWRNHGQF